MKHREDIQGTRKRQQAWIKAIHERTGHSYSRIAKEIGVSQTTITRFMDDGQHQGALSAITEAKIGRRYGASRELPEGSELHSDDDDTVIILQYDVKAAAGGGKHVEQEVVIGSWTVPYSNLRGRITSPKNVAIISVAGDSMEPEYRDGDLVFVDLGYHDFTHDGVYVLDFGDGLMIKHVQRDLASPDNFLIISQNPVYKDQVSPIATTHIKGRVIGKWDWR